MLYIISALCMTAFYIGVILSMGRMRSTKLWNGVFAASIFMFYLNVVISIYLDAGLYDWNFQNTLPAANVSPFMFVLTPLLCLLPSAIKKHLRFLITLLSVGMFLAAVVGCAYNAAIGYKFHPHFICDYMAHVLLSLWGVYFVKSKQVEPKLKNALISAGIIISVALCMLLCNVALDTAFFGLSLNGKHNIYNVIVTDNSYLSAALYFAGLSLVLSLGFAYARVLAKDRLLGKRKGVAP